MRKLLSVLSVALLFTAGSAFARNCPVQMKAIDDKLASKPALSKDVSDKVMKLRAEGEAAHKAGNHPESEQKMSEAKKLLGI